jgi:hypothetical protein
MSLTIINKIASNLPPNASSQTLSYNNQTGTFLFVVVCMADSVDFTTGTYGGDSMTKSITRYYPSTGQRVAIFTIFNPKANTNNIVINFDGSQTNNTSIYAASWTNSSGLGNDANNGLVTSPNSQTLTVSTNSRIYLMGESSAAQSFNYDIDGSSRTPEFNGHSIGSGGTVILEGALSAAGLSSGSKTCVTKADAGTVTNLRFEIQEGSPPDPPAGRRRIVIC